MWAVNSQAQKKSADHRARRPSLQARWSADQLPAASVRLPARDMGSPYLARFSSVSGTGPFVTTCTLALAFTPALVAEGASAVVSVALASGVLMSGLTASPPTVALASTPVGLELMEPVEPETSPAGRLV